MPFSWSRSIYPKSRVERVSFIDEAENGINTINTLHCPSHNNSYDSTYRTTVNSSNYSSNRSANRSGDRSHNSGY